MCQVQSGLAQVQIESLQIKSCLQRGFTGSDRVNGVPKVSSNLTREDNQRHSRLERKMYQL
jgi:hypothetical protein